VEIKPSTPLSSLEGPENLGLDIEFVSVFCFSSPSVLFLLSIGEIFSVTSVLIVSFENFSTVFRVSVLFSVLSSFLLVSTILINPVFIFSYFNSSLFIIFEQLGIKSTSITLIIKEIPKKTLNLKSSF